MQRPRRLTIAFSVLLTILLVSLFSVHSFNTDFGNLDYSTVTIKTDQGNLSGLLYKPLDSENKQFPGIVVAHGISESAQILSGFGLELARAGFVVLCLDLPGHGGSEGTISQAERDQALGVNDAVNYLSNLSYVDSRQIGLVGHSLGAGAVRAANLKLSNVQSSVLIGGGVGEVASVSDYGPLNATYPKNILVIIGKYDVLFDISELRNKNLLFCFNTTGTIQQDKLYGDLNSQTARKLIVPQTTHLFESLDYSAIQETTNWMKQTLKNNPDYENQQGLIYQYREIAQILSVSTLLGLILLTFNPIATLLKEKPKTINQEVIRPQNKINLIWFSVNIVLFFPLIAVGFLIGFPPLVFGSSMAWWLLLIALITFVILIKAKLQISFTKISVLHIFNRYLPQKNVFLIAVVLFTLLVALSTCLQFFGVSLKIVAPIFQGFASAKRLLVFFSFLPFFLPFFCVQQMYIISFDFLRKGKYEYMKTVLLSISPFILFLGLNFLPKLFFDFWIIPSFAGFLIEFLWLIIPIFMITTFCSLYFYKQTNSLVLGAVFNTLLLSWIASTVFPF